MTDGVSYECPFKIGDKVIVIAPPEEQKNITPQWITSMDTCIGKTGTVYQIKPKPEIDAYILRLKGLKSKGSADMKNINWRDSWLVPAHDTYTLF